MIPEFLKNIETYNKTIETDTLTIKNNSLTTSAMIKIGNLK